MSDAKMLPLDLADINVVVNGLNVAQILADIVRSKFWGDWYILEAGSGTGKIGMFYALHYQTNVTLMDLDQNQLARSMRILACVEYLMNRRLAVGMRLGNVLHIPYKDDTFDFCYSEGVVEHFSRSDPRRLRCIQEMVRVSRDYVGIITNDLEGERSRQRAETTKHVYPSMPEKEEPYTKEELRDNMEKAGLGSIQVVQYSDPGTQEFLIASGRKMKK